MKKVVAAVFILKWIALNNFQFFSGRTHTEAKATATTAKEKKLKHKLQFGIRRQKHFDIWVAANVSFNDSVKQFSSLSVCLLLLFRFASWILFKPIIVGIDFLLFFLFSISALNLFLSDPANHIWSALSASHFTQVYVLIYFPFSIVIFDVHLKWYVPYD